MKILLVTPDSSIKEHLYHILSRHHFTVDLSGDGEAAWCLLQTYYYDLVLSEIPLPKLDGLKLCHRLREIGNPILILLLVESSRDERCIQGLNHGADACLHKPIQEASLLAQIYALARRGGHRANSLLTWGPLSLNLTSRQVSCNGQLLKLNRKEYQILELFLNHPRQMFPRSEIGDRLWTLDEQLPTDATIKSHIRSIRRKLESSGAHGLIQTHYGQGYCLDPIYAPGIESRHGSTYNQPRRGTDAITANLWQELMKANAHLQQEIEQRKEIESQLRRSEMMLRDAQRVAQIGCWEYDFQTQEVFWSEELFIIHGLDPKQFSHGFSDSSSMIHPEDIQIYEKKIRAPAIRQEKFEANVRIIRVNDKEVRYINARGGPICNQAGEVIKIAGTTFDVTPWVTGRFP